MKFNRRQLLWSGLGTAIATALGKDHLQHRSEQAQQAQLESLATENFSSETLLEEVYQADQVAVQELFKVQQSVMPKAPPTPYSRDWSKLLIRANKMATQQYLTGKYQADYDGDIRILPLYSEGFADYRQITSFQAAEQVQERLTVEVPITELFQNEEQMQQHLERTKEAFETQVKQAVQIVQSIPVYYGYLLTSAEAHLLVFRGTQRTNEYAGDIFAFQTDYFHPITNALLGKVHLGFYYFYQQNLGESVIEAVQALDPSKPLFITGHSLGAALANLAAFNIALKVPQLQASLRLYAYAPPRVGDPTWVRTLNRLVPNSYRVINLADMIPMMPTSKLFGKLAFAHAGEQWSFLSQQGDMLPNHIVETYRLAIEQEQERTTGKGFDNLHLSG